MAALCSRINGGNLMSKLLFREVRGSLQTHRHQRKEKFFKKIPGRLCFKLTSLVPRVLLDDGYVFLGFTKDGQFVISYSLQVDTDENTGFLPVYVYNLQWWWFIPYKPLKKKYVFLKMELNQIFSSLSVNGLLIDPKYWCMDIVFQEVEKKAASVS
ncbi:Hypothetical predicted protein [Octopus vulgaris]|uniref:DDB1- and CUL4-associated factor 15 WD40 repeat-containing domain-containing protein n=1 Tax=Octopus vulgaris TaxID=6645 RepID=A0AA36F8A8_OCTVU|nr:Hypothetical predicted protein [Octopus vulgaris]